MGRATVEVADIFRALGPGYRQRHRLAVHQHKLMRAIEQCRTAALGGHVEQCDHCAQQRISYNSCRNRHCPKCQNLARARWLQRRKAELLPVEYFHVVFTIPEQLHALALCNPKVIYNLLFQTSAAALQSIANDPKHLGAQTGFFSVLHTWGQNLTFHPHIHCVVTGGGLSPSGERWIFTKPGFLLSVRVLSRRFRNLLLQALQRAFIANRLLFPDAIRSLSAAYSFRNWLTKLRRKDWVVYSKPPFGGPQQVVEYLGRYTHRVAISNQRLVAFDGQAVTFRYKDYRSRCSQTQRMMTLDGEEFIRRFLLHSLPPGFQRIRHYGILASSNKSRTLSRARVLLQAAAHPAAPTAEEIRDAMAEITAPIHRCPACGIGTMLVIELLPAVRLLPSAYDSS